MNITTSPVQSNDLWRQSRGY